MTEWHYRQIVWKNADMAYSLTMQAADDYTDYTYTRVNHERTC